MSSDIILLIYTAIIIAFVHTVTGPDHYIPFIVMGKARNWSYSKTLWLTFICGIGHVGSSIVLGIIGIILGIGLHQLKIFESSRGNIAAWAFLVFGILYFVYGMIKAYRNKPHTHIHYHEDGSEHLHEHKHFDEHTHVHQTENKVNLTPWILFVVFILGPCEPLIPLLMYPAAQTSYMGLTFVAVSFSIVTIGTMVSVVYLGLRGIQFIPMKFAVKYVHAIAGGTIAVCGLAILFLGL